MTGQIVGDTEWNGLPMPRRLWAILAVTFGVALSVLDGTIANVALPTIAHELGVSSADSIWVVNAYQLAIVVSLLSFSTLGDVVGVVDEQGTLFVHPILGGEQQLHAAHGQEADNNHQGHDGKIFGKNAFEHAPNHVLSYSSRPGRIGQPAAPSLTSNLYPTPQTVFSVH